MSVTELPENLREFEELGLFRPDDYVPPQKSAKDTLTLEQLPAESFATRARQLGKNMLRGVWHSPRTRSYGLGLGLGSTAIATGVAVAFLAPHHYEPSPTQPPQELLIMPSNSSPAQPPKSSETPQRMQPAADPSDISTLFPSSSRTRTSLPSVAESLPYTASTTPAETPRTSAPVTPHPVAPSASWSTMYPTGSAAPEATTPTNTPPSDTPTMPLETSDATMSELPETPPTSLLPPLGD